MKRLFCLLVGHTPITDNEAPRLNEFMVFVDKTRWVHGVGLVCKRCGEMWIERYDPPRPRSMVVVQADEEAAAANKKAAEWMENVTMRLGSIVGQLDELLVDTETLKAAAKPKKGKAALRRLPNRGGR